MNHQSIHNPVALEAARRHAGIEPEALRRWRAAFFRRHTSWSESLKVLPADCREAFAAALHVRTLTLVERQDSARDRAAKLAFETQDGQVLEAVLMQADSGRTSLCVSSQLGCPANCGFCATGGLPFVRNLTADEILDQVIQAARLASGPLRNVVFMGMGEPLLNLASVRQAVEALVSPQVFGLAERRVLVSTCGLPAELLELGRVFPGIGLAVSLHSARQEIREQLMPIARRHGLDQLRACLQELASIAKHEIMLEILLLDGINDAPADAEALAAFAQGLPAYVNLLAYNPIPSRPDLRPADEASYQLFTEKLEATGHKVTRRYSHGGDIAAACGQLAAARQTSPKSAP